MSAVQGFSRLFVRHSASGLNALLSRVRGASACSSSSRAVLRASFGPTKGFGCVSLSPILPSQSSVPASSFERVVQHALSHTRRPQKGMPLAQGVAFLASKGQLTRQHLMSGMSQLAEVFIDNAHTYSVEELSAWCEICRQLEFVGSERNHQAMTEAVRSALEGRMSELQPSELPGVAWMLASADMPLPPAMEKELVRSITNQCEELTAEECLVLSEAAGRLSMAHHKDLASALTRTAAHSLRDCDPAAAIRLAATALPATLPHTAPERGMLVSSLAAHMKSREKQYLSDHHTLEQALSLVVDLAAGQPALQEHVRAVQHMAHCLPQDAFRPLELPPLCAHAM